ncbi:MAG: HEAT repeat domain-containing protein [Acidobacteriota bacterium]|nr:HEAT repeat domain-containing protein [Acidobacteriota bacterium]
MNISNTVLGLGFLSLFTLLEAQPNVTAWDILNQGVNDKNPEKRKQAIAAVGSLGLAPEAIKLVESALRNDEDVVVRQTAAASLGQMKAKQSIPALQQALDDHSGEVAFQAAKSLWELGDRSAASGDGTSGKHASRNTLQDVLTGELKDATGIREGAMRDAKAKLHSPRALAKIGIKEASGALLGPFSLGVNAAEEMMKDTGASGRANAATLLAQDCDSRTLQLLDHTLKDDKNAAVKAAAARGVGLCGTKDSIPVLEQHLSDSHDAVKFMAAAAIVRLSMNGAPTPVEKN